MDKRVEESKKANYREWWIGAGKTWSWLILCLNIIGNLVLVKEILDLRKLNGAAIAQWQIGVGFTYMAWVMWPSVLVIICLGFNLKFATTKIKKQWLYLLVAFASVIVPLILISNASTLIGIDTTRH